MSSPSSIRLSKSCIGQEEKDAVAKVLDKEFLGMGEEVLEFERLLEEFFGRPCVCVANGTAALHLALQAVGIGPGDEVLVPSLTYLASFQAISAAGATPVACDVEEGNCLLSLKDAAGRITSRTKAVMPVFYAGQTGDLNGFHAFARNYGLRVIEDAAHAFGSKFGGKRIGSFGDISCFSFDGIKNITSGEGGCLVSDDPSVLSKARDARLLGVENDSRKRAQNLRSWSFQVNEQGWRYHMSNHMAAIGIVQLGRFEFLARKRVHLAETYLRLIKPFCGADGIIIPIHSKLDQCVPHIFPIRVMGMNYRDRLLQYMKQYGVELGLHYQPNHLPNLYRKDTASPLTITEKIYPELLSLPLHPDLSEDDCELIVKHLIEGLRLSSV